ncbi:hypothetical protein FBZ99_10752 [Rhizobium sp. ERR 1071]|uniref:MFS transporter n=1 Tax=Rhizobium sp. ERR 1071 TaxID=2572677 RepID=UPI00119C6E3D|nr:MFS transporter [Rhizobium sp. ERR1071]TWB12004.1 hypothetical protein FBZ99_10752 [Rhizobium sp. ERR1071]
MLSIHAATPFSTIIPVFLIAGGGIPLIVPSVMTTAISESETGRAGIGAGVLNSARQIGGAIGVALFGSIIGAVGSTAFVEGMHISVGLAVATFLASAAAVFVFIRS